MVIGAEASQLHLFGILNLLGITVTPFHGHLRIRIGVDENIEGAVAIQNREEGDRSGDLTENSLDLLLDFFFCLLDGL